ncbi:MAG: hypothetical protein IPL61_40315 [Myxococcales bacterium]|nr:hypothetical protein [Myxococcales bacterium]
MQRAGATVTALLLNLEAAFTVVLARLWYREVIGPRVALALLAMAAGGAAVVVPGSAWTVGATLGMIAVAGATLAWATDNALTRPLAERMPLDVPRLAWAGDDAVAQGAGCGVRRHRLRLSLVDLARSARAPRRSLGLSGDPRAT